jgi:hypothetical protein
VYLTVSNQSTVNAPNAVNDNSTSCYNTTGPAYSTSVSNGAGANCALSFQMQGAGR